MLFRLSSNHRLRQRTVGWSSPLRCRTAETAASRERRFDQFGVTSPFVQNAVPDRFLAEAIAAAPPVPSEIRRLRGLGDHPHEGRKWRLSFECTGMAMDGFTTTSAGLGDLSPQHLMRLTRSVLIGGWTAFSAKRTFTFVLGWPADERSQWYRVQSSSLSAPRLSAARTDAFTRARIGATHAVT
jgi:hypothetical protein